MVIDCHTHLGRNDHIRASVDQLLTSMDEAGIDQSLVFAGELNDYPTYEMLKEIKPHRDRLHGVASWNFNRFDYQLACQSLSYGVYALGKPQADLFAELYKAKQIVAVKFYVGYYHYMPADPEITHALSVLEKVGCPAIFHCGDCLNSVKCSKLKYSHPLNIDEVAVDFPNMNFIIAHMGWPWHRDAAEVCYKNENVYSDISGFVYGAFENNGPNNTARKFKKVLEEFIDICDGGHKLLFGTDWPISNQASYLKTLKEDIGMGLTPEFLSDNVKKAFRL